MGRCEMCGAETVGEFKMSTRVFNEGCMCQPYIWRDDLGWEIEVGQRKMGSDGSMVLVRELREDLRWRNWFGLTRIEDLIIYRDLEKLDCRKPDAMVLGKIVRLVEDLTERVEGSEKVCISVADEDRFFMIWWSALESKLRLGGVWDEGEESEDGDKGCGKYSGGIELTLSPTKEAVEAVAIEQGKPVGGCRGIKVFQKIMQEICFLGEIKSNDAKIHTKEGEESYLVDLEQWVAIGNLRGIEI